MRFELFVAVRYLLARRKQAVVSVVTLVSILGVSAGVMALIVALSLNSGFQEEFRQRILGATSHVSLLRPGNLPVEDFPTLLNLLQGTPGVLSAAPTIYVPAQLSSEQDRQHGVILRGVDLGQPGVLDYVIERIVEGSIADFGVDDSVPSVMIGRELSANLGVLVGDYLQALGTQGELSPLGRMPRIQNFRVVAIYDSGLWDYDANWALIPLSAAQRFAGMRGDQASSLEFRIREIDNAEAVADEILRRVDRGFVARTWIELNRPLFSALQLEKLALFVAIGLIVMVASLNIVSTLTLMVMEKNRDIAIISAMGGDSGTITRIFMLQGLIIGVFGTVLGGLLGSLSVWYFDTYQVFPLEPQVYSISFVPFRLSLQDVGVVCVTAVLICFLATLYPARAAARLDPMEAIRYE